MRSHLLIFSFICDIDEVTIILGPEINTAPTTPAPTTPAPTIPAPTTTPTTTTPDLTTLTSTTPTPIISNGKKYSETSI